MPDLPHAARHGKPAPGQAHAPNSGDAHRDGPVRMPCMQGRLDEGYIAIVECDEATRTPTGPHAFVKRETWGHIFTMPIPPQGICMAPPEVLETLRKMADGAEVGELK